MFHQLVGTQTQDCTLDRVDRFERAVDTGRQCQVQFPGAGTPRTSSEK